MSLKRDDSARQENSKPSVFAKLEIAEKRQKYLVRIEKEKQKLTLIVIF